MTSMNVLLQGEGENLQSKRKALITAIFMNTGTLIGSDKYFLFKIQHKLKRKTTMKFFQSKNTSKTKIRSLLFLDVEIS